MITVKKAWEELERAGLINTMVGRGCFVAPLKAAELSGKRDSMARNKLMKDIEYYKSLGLTVEELIALVRKYYDDNE